MDTEIDNEEEGRAIRDFSEENEDVYFEDEYEDEVVNEQSQWNFSDNNYYNRLPG